MIYPESKIFISDNSGARLGRCIKVLKNSYRNGTKPSDIVILSLRKVKPNKKLNKGDISRGVFIRGRKNVQRSTGLSIKFDDNAVILINDKNLPISTRIFGPVYKELYYYNFSKVLSLARTII